MRIGIPAELRPGETRIAATPDTAEKLLGQIVAAALLCPRGAMPRK